MKNNKPILVGFILVLIIGIAIASVTAIKSYKNNNISNSVLSGWKKYTLPDPNSSITFQYPADWTLSPECANQVPLTDCVMSPDFLTENLANSSSGTTKGAYMGLRFNHPEAEGTKVSLDNYSTQCHGNCTNTTIDGKAGLIIKDNSTETVHVITSPETDLSIFYSYDKNNEAKDLEIFNQIIDGFKFN
jgi:hypothetical protein